LFSFPLSNFLERRQANIIIIQRPAGHSLLSIRAGRDLVYFLSTAKKIIALAGLCPAHNAAAFFSITAIIGMERVNPVGGKRSPD
jgi:hypothetical protein